MKQIIKKELNKIINSLGANALIKFTPSKGHADLATNIAMQISKELKDSPMNVANKIKSSLNLDFIEKIEVVNPGFINIFFNDKVFTSQVENIINLKDNFGQGNENKYINVEYVSANPTGHLHIGHARGAVLGSILINILKKSGNKVDSEYYINDAGNQISTLGNSVRIRYLQLLNEKIELPENSYKGEDIKDVALCFLNKYKDVLKNESSKRFEIESKDFLLNIIKEHLKKYNIKIDLFSSEQNLYDKNKIKPVLKKLAKQNHTYEKDGALWLKTIIQGDDKDRVLRKSNGDYTYFTPDIAYHDMKLSRGYDELINIWGADHIGYIKRMQIALEYLGLPKDKLDIITIQLVKLFKDGKELKMSKRMGTSFTINELIDEVGVDAARWFMVDRTNNSEFIFNIDLAKKQSSDNPVFLVQYTNARTHQLIKKSLVVPKPEKYTTKEKELINLLNYFPNLIKNISSNHKVHLLPQYLLEVSNIFNSWYSNTRAIGNKRECSLIALVQATQIIITNGLKLMDINSPKKM